MKEDVNKRILDKIDDTEFNQETKKFLKRMLIWELRHIEEGRPRFRDAYEKEIQMSAGKK